MIINCRAKLPVRQSDENVDTELINEMTFLTTDDIHNQQANIHPVSKHIANDNLPQYVYNCEDPKLLSFGFSAFIQYTGPFDPFRDTVSKIVLYLSLFYFKYIIIYIF